MILRERLKNKIINDTGENSFETYLFNCMMGALKPGAIHYIPLYFLAQITKENIKSEKLMDAASYLSKEPISLLELEFEFIDDSDESYDLTLFDIESTITEGAFFHPMTGKAVKNYNKKIFIYYRGTEQLDKALKNE